MATKIIPISQFSGSTGWINGIATSISVVGSQVYITYIPNPTTSDPTPTPTTEPVNTSNTEANGGMGIIDWDDNDDIEAYIDTNDNVVVENITKGETYVPGNLKGQPIMVDHDTIVATTDYNEIHFQLLNLGDFEFYNRVNNPKTIEHNGFLYMLNNIKYTDSDIFWVSVVRYEVATGLCSVVNLGRDFLSQFSEFDNDEYFENNYFDVFVLGDIVYLIMEAPQPSVSPYVQGTYFIFLMSGTGISLQGVYHTTNYLDEQPINNNGTFVFKDGDGFTFPSNSPYNQSPVIYENGYTYYGNNGVLVVINNNIANIYELLEKADMILMPETGGLSVIDIYMRGNVMPLWHITSLEYESVPWDITIYNPADLSIKQEIRMDSMPGSGLRADEIMIATPRFAGGQGLDHFIIYVKRSPEMYYFAPDSNGVYSYTDLGYTIFDNTMILDFIDTSSGGRFAFYDIGASVPEIVVIDYDNGSFSTGGRSIPVADGYDDAVYYMSLTFVNEDILLIYCDHSGTQYQVNGTWYSAYYVFLYNIVNGTITPFDLTSNPYLSGSMNRTIYAPYSSNNDYFEFFIRGRDYGIDVICPYLYDNGNMSQNKSTVYAPKYYDSDYTITNFGDHILDDADGRVAIGFTRRYDPTGTYEHGIAVYDNNSTELVPFEEIVPVDYIHSFGFSGDLVPYTAGTPPVIVV